MQDCNKTQFSSLISNKTAIKLNFQVWYQSINAEGYNSWYIYFRWPLNHLRWPSQLPLKAIIDTLLHHDLVNFVFTAMENYNLFTENPVAHL